MNNKLKILLFMGVTGLASCKNGCFFNCCEDEPWYKSKVGDAEHYINVGDRFEWSSNKGEVVIGTCVKKELIETNDPVCYKPKNYCDDQPCKNQTLKLWFKYENDNNKYKLNEIEYIPSYTVNHIGWNNYSEFKSFNSNRRNLDSTENFKKGFFGKTHYDIILKSNDTITWDIRKM